ncbi:MAG: c-type cytochrome [Gammaproteobacteria bacterium]|nr:c-type cytochrome [Gammaproteobacteria bacterium]
MRQINLLKLLVIAASLLIVSPTFAKPGDVDRGKGIYDKRCTWCHGDEGDGTGAAEERLNPPPRDFTSGNYKIKTTAFDEMIPNDEDVFRMIRDGMPGTAMPGWSSLLSEQDMWDLVAYVKVFAEFEEAPEQQVDYGTPVASSPESIAQGKELFEDGDRCVECHGKTGKGSAIKRLKGDVSERTWPRNLTKPWTFRGSNDPKDIFTRISTGIAGTEMPSFADPKSKKMLSIKERWHVANYVASLAKTQKVVNAENTVIKADMLEGDLLPDSPDDERWEQTIPTTFLLVPQIIGEERFFKPSNDTITVRALYNDKAIAMLMEWDDRTKSIPGDERAEKIADKPIQEDGVAVQLPVEIPKKMQKPYFGMGDASRPVNIWHWKSGTKDTAETVAMINSRGFQDIEARDAAEVGLQAKGSYKDGTWRVVMVRPLTTADPENDLQFVEGRFIPVAFAAWDGSNNSEKGSRHTMTTWYWLLLKPSTGAMPIIMALVIAGLFAGALLWWARSAAGGRKPQADSKEGTA